MVSGDDDGPLGREKASGGEKFGQDLLAVGGVEMLGGFVEQHDRSGRNQRAGEQQSSALAGRDRGRAADENRGQPVGQRVQPAAQAHPPQRGAQLVVGGVAAGDQQVVPHGGGEQVRVLGEERCVRGFSPSFSAMAISSVVLPEPLGPVTANRSPGSQVDVGTGGRASVDRRRVR